MLLYPPEKATLTAFDWDDVRCRCSKFAADIKPSRARLYNDIRGGDPDNQTNSQIAGKIGEFAAADYLHKAYGLPLIEPDMSIYAIENVEHDPDLIYHLATSPCYVHVKTSTDDDEANISWVFQRRHAATMIYLSPTYHRMLFLWMPRHCDMYDAPPPYSVYFCGRPEWLRGCHEEMRKANLRSTKVAFTLAKLQEKRRCLVSS